MRTGKFTYFTLGVLLAAAALFGHASAQAALNIHQATLSEPDQKTREVSTDELRRILAERSAIVLDARPFMEFAISHIPGAVNVSAKPGVPMSMYISDVAEIDRVVKGDKRTPLVLYCNGPFCGKSKRLAAELLEAGFTDVRRYQLGIPVWRALGGITETDLDAFVYVLANDKTCAVIDARDPAEFKANGLANAKNLPQRLLKPGKDVGEIKAAKDDGRLPMLDHNTRIIIYGKSVEQAKAVASAIANEAFHNVSYFNGTVEQLLQRRK